MVGPLYSTMRTCHMCKKNFEQEGGGENLDEVWTMWGKTHWARSF